VQLLRTILPLKARATDYVFTDREEQPLDQSEFARKFQDVLRVLEIRPRPFYNTRHTFITVALLLWGAIRSGLPSKLERASL
jgi:hypothetical protein